MGIEVYCHGLINIEVKKSHLEPQENYNKPILGSQKVIATLTVTGWEDYPNHVSCA
jgi:hypothetical protein